MNALPGIQSPLVIELVHLFVIREYVNGSDVEIIQDLSSLSRHLFCLVYCFENCVVLDDKWIKNEREFFHEILDKVYFELVVDSHILMEDVANSGELIDEGNHMRYS